MHWVYTLKYKPISGPEEKTEFHLDDYYCAKARLTARGDQQEVDKATSAPVAGKDLIRLALALVPTMKWRIGSVDVSNAFLQGPRLDPDDTPIYVRPPIQAKCGTKLWRVVRSIYGLKDAPLNWYSALKNILQDIGGRVSPSEPTLFFFHEKTKQIRKVKWNFKKPKQEIEVLGLNEKMNGCQTILY